MARRLYLHIGTMKAATSYLQSMFDLNTERLAADGILWQSSRLNQNAVHEFQGSDMLLPDLVGSWQRLRRGVRRHDGDVLMSMELLARLPLPRIRRIVEALAPQELHVVITARDLSRLVPSAWQETMQNRGTEPWADWVRRVCLADPAEPEGRMPFWQHHYLPAIVEKWSQVAAPGGVHLLTIPQQRSDPMEVWRRFASVLGVPPEGYVEPQFANAAIGGTSAELMRRLNTQTADLDFLHYRWGFKSALAKRALSLRAGSEPRPTVPSDLHPRLYEISKDMTEQVADMGVDVVGDLADLVPAETAPADGYDPGQSTDAELLAVATEGLVSLGRRVADLQVERGRLRRTNAELRRKLRARSVAGRLEEARRVAEAKARSGEERLRSSRLAESRLADAARGARRRLRRRRPR